MKTKFKQFLLGNIVSLIVFSGCFQVAQATEGYFSQTALKQSFTHKNKNVKYRTGVLVIGAPRDNVVRWFGEPNGTDMMPGGTVEDVYIFTPDGSKYVNPHPRPRNVALGIFTMGTSVVVHQATLAYQRTGLTVYRVYYNLDHRIVKVKIIKGSALKNPASTQ
jgi:hypothetical protein